MMLINTIKYELNDNESAWIKLVAAYHGLTFCFFFLSAKTGERCHFSSESAWNWAFIFSCSNDHLGPTEEHVGTMYSWIHWIPIWIFQYILSLKCTKMLEYIPIYSNGYSNHVVFFGNREVTMFTASQRWSFVNRKLGHQPFRCVLHVTPLRAPAFAVSLSPRWDLVP